MNKRAEDMSIGRLIFYLLVAWIILGFIAFHLVGKAMAAWQNERNEECAEMLSKANDEEDSLRVYLKHRGCASD